MSNTNSAISVDMARYHMQGAKDAMEAYWGRSTSDTDGQMNDIRRAVDSLIGGIAALANAVENLDRAAVEQATRLDTKEQQ